MESIDILQQYTRNAIFERIKQFEVKEVRKRNAARRLDWCYLITMAIFIMMIALGIALGIVLTLLYFSIMYHTPFDITNFHEGFLNKRS